MSRPDLQDFWSELGDIQSNKVPEDAEDGAKTPDEGEQEAAWLEQAGLGMLVHQFQAGKELSEDEVNYLVHSLPRNHIEVVKRRVDTLNATLRKKQKYTTKIDVRNIFPQQPPSNEPTSTTEHQTSTSPRGEVVHPEWAEQRSQASRGRQGSLMKNKGGYSMTGLSEEVQDNLESGVATLSVYQTGTNHTSLGQLSPISDRDITFEFSIMEHNGDSSPLRGEVTIPSLLSHEVGLPNFMLVPDPLGLTRITDISPTDVTHVKNFALLELTSMYDTHNISYTRRRSKKRYKEHGIFGVPLQTLLEHDQKLAPDTRVPIVYQEGDRVPFTRPWQTPVPPLGGSVETVVRYAADDESHGIVNVAWRGPAARDQYTYNSVSLLLDYLTDSAISPLQREFVEVDDHYCSHVNGGLIENSECTVFFKFNNVVTEKLRDIYPRLMSVLSGLTKGTEKLNMGRMANLIHRRVLDALSSLEDSPHDKMASYLIGDFLFSNTKQDMEDRVQMVPCHERMKTEPEAFWLGLINKFFIDKHYVLILGEPSTAERESLAQAEADRVARQQANLGKDGLQEKAAILEKATEENERGVPESMIVCVDVPDVASIFFHPIIPSCNRSAGNNRLTENADFPLDKIPFRFELDDIHTNFVQINALLDSSNVPQELKYYLPLFCEVLFESPLERDGVIVPHEDVISQLEDDVQKTEISLGVKGSSFSCGNFPQVVHIKIQVGKEKYERGVTWLREILYQTKFPADRLRTVAKRLSSAISQYKRKGNSVMNALIRNIVFSEDCNHYVSSMLRQGRFLEQLLIRLDSEPKQIEEHLEQLRALITSPDNLTVHLSVNVKELAKVVSNPERVWATVVPPGRDGRESSSIKMRPPFDYVVPISECKTPSVIAGLGSVESAYLIQGVSCVKSHLHEDLAPIMVYIQFLIQMEGPMWRQIRGLGLSYHYSMYVQPDTGMLYFLLARSTHIVNAYKEGKDIVMNYVNCVTEFTDIELESAKSSLTFLVIEKETTVSDVAHHSILAYLRDIPHSYNKDLLSKISRVTLEDLRRVGKEYISALFDETRVRRAVVCNQAKVNEVTETFKELQVPLHVIPSLEDDTLCSY